MDTAFLVRLFGTIGVLWLLQTVMDTLGTKEPAKKVLFVLTLIVGILWILFGSSATPTIFLR